MKFNHPQTSFVFVTICMIYSSPFIENKINFFHNFEKYEIWLDEVISENIPH